MRLLLLALLASCKIVTTSGDASMPTLGEQYRCIGTVTCPDTAPFDVDDRFCLPRNSLYETLEVFNALYPGCFVQGVCKSVGGMENGGIGISRPCVLDEEPSE